GPWSQARAGRCAGEGGGARRQAGPQEGSGEGRRPADAGRWCGPRTSGIDMSEGERVSIVGGGLAGCEAGWQLARAGIGVDLFEMRPRRGTAAHATDRLGELVCSNSFRNGTLETAVGLLKEEMRQLGSLVMQVADRHQVPAGSCLAV